MSRKIEEKVNSTFQKATPDISQSVIDRCKSTTVFRAQPQKRSSATFWKLATLALALVLVITGVFGGIELGATAQAAVVSLDVNPSIELKIDSRNRVIEAIANNDDAEVILQSMDLKGSTLEVAVYAIIGSMHSHGYLSEYTNSVLVSVDTKNESTYNEIIDAVTSRIQVTLKEQNIDSSVVSQWIKDKDTAAQIANEYNVSIGKATLITKIIEASSNDTSENATTYTVEDLVKRSVNELALILSKYAGEQTVELKADGNASEKAYIGKDQALKIALDAVGLYSDLDTGIDLKAKVDFDIEKGVLVYEVEFVYGDYKYEIDVKAVDGEIIKTETKLYNHAEDHTLPNLGDAELIAKATEGFEDVTNAQITERDGDEVVVSFQVGDYNYQVEITLKGTVVKVEKHLTTQIDSNLLSEEKIKQIAQEILSRHSGYLEGKIDEIECELSDDGSYYEVEIKVMGFEFELRIDAKTGEPIRIGGGFEHSWNGSGETDQSDDKGETEQPDDKK